MPRVVLLATDPDLSTQHVTAQVTHWTCEPLELVLVSLYPLDDVDAVDPLGPWTGATTDAEPWTLRGWTYGEVPPPDVPPQPPSRAQRAQEQAVRQERSHRLWDLVAADAALAPLLGAADAVAALDIGGIRSAFHLARRHDIPVATNGLVPALVELAAHSAR